MTELQNLQFENTYAEELEGLYAPWQDFRAPKGAQAPSPAIVQVNRALAEDLGIDAEALNSARGAEFVVGSWAPESARPLAQAYAGHQFGGFTPQLGDGRALLIGERLDRGGHRRDIQLKGSGRTPFSRNGDGKAGIGPVLREYLVSEFMHAVGIPTTRALAAATTGESIVRDPPQPGAVLVRVASSHIRVGSFEFFAARGDVEKLRRLVDYTIQRHYPEIADGDDPYLSLLRAVGERQALLIAKWMGVGFVHGVMNTDNTTLSGETIDYGPCAFMDRFDVRSVFSSIDHAGRYAYANQPVIGQWNLARFAEALLGLVDKADSSAFIDAATKIVQEFPQRYELRWLEEMSTKLGLKTSSEDRELVKELHVAVEAHAVDFTRFFRGLSGVLRGDPCDEAEKAGGAVVTWLARWQERHRALSNDPEETARALDRVNPIYIPRNHKVEEALDAAIRGDLGPFEKLQQVLASPYQEAQGFEDFAGPAPTGFGEYTTYCGT